MMESGVQSLYLERPYVWSTHLHVPRFIAQRKMPQRPQALSLRFILQDTSILRSCASDLKVKRPLVYKNLTKEKRLRECREASCTKYSHQGGFCVGHGGGKRCPVENCSKAIQTGGLCYRHGGGRRCRVSNCNRAAKRKGFCCGHFKTSKLIY